MADSPGNSPPAPEATNTGSPPSNNTSPPTPPVSSPPSPISAPPPVNSSPPPAPPSQETSSQPPPPSPSTTTSPPAVSNPPPQIPSPPSPEISTPGTPPAPPQQPPLNQSPPSQIPQSPPSPDVNNDRNRNNDGSNNRDGGSTTLSPPSGNRTSSDSGGGGGGDGGGSSSPPRSISPPWSSGNSDSSSSSSSGDSNHQPDIGLIVGVVVGAGLLLLILLLICICCKKKKKKNSPQVNHMHYYNNNPYGAPTGNGNYFNNGKPQDHVVNMGTQGNGTWGQQQQQPTSGPHSDNSNLTGPTGATQSPQAVTLGHNQSTFTYDELSIATEGFSQSNLLGQGGFGYVHKGVLPSGKEVAVKSLKLGSGQGEREFQAEVEIISRVHHRHLVSLVGYCISGDQRLLVYEFLPNNTLEFHLHGKGRPVMDWPTRVKIALGSARGLAYLHEDCHPRIIHRDIKAANILLDFSFETKVADFGLAKLSQDNYTHVSTRIMGTFGYLAPEYASSGKLSDKSDVFSFGVMLLELITGRPPIDLTGEMEDSLVDWARPLCLKGAQDGDYSQLADPRLERNYEQQEMARMASCAAAAIRHSARRRPKMSQIVRALEGDVSMDDLSEGTRPGQNTYASPGSVTSEYDASSYSADMKKFRKMALESKEYQSSEYGGTSEYGLNPSASSSEEMHRSSMKRNHQL